MLSRHIEFRFNFRAPMGERIVPKSSSWANFVSPNRLRYPPATTVTFHQTLFQWDLLPDLAQGLPLVDRSRSNCHRLLVIGGSAMGAQPRWRPWSRHWTFPPHSRLSDSVTKRSDYLVKSWLNKILTVFLPFKASGSVWMILEGVISTASSCSRLLDLL